MSRVVGRVSLVVVLTIASSCQSSDSPLSRSVVPDSKRRSLELVQVVSAPEEPTIVSADRQGVVAAGRYGAVAAFNSAGREIWRKTVTEPGQQILRPMAITPDRVVVPSTPDRIVVLNRDTGQEKWARPVSNPWSVGIDTNTAAVVSRTGILTIFAVATGNLYGEQNLGFSEAVVDVRVWVRGLVILVAWADAAGAHIVALDTYTGIQNWRRDSPLFSTMPAVVADQICNAENQTLATQRSVTNGKEDPPIMGRIYCAAISDGTIRWEQTLPGFFEQLLDVAANADTVAAINIYGDLVVFDSKSGEMRWRRATNRDQIEAPLRIAGSVVVLPTYGTSLLAFDLMTGKRVFNENPKARLGAVTIEDQAGGSRLFLLVRAGRGTGEVWVLEPSRTPALARAKAARLH